MANSTNIMSLRGFCIGNGGRMQERALLKVMARGGRMLPPLALPIGRA